MKKELSTSNVEGTTSNQGGNHAFAAALGKVSKDARRPGGKRRFALTAAGANGYVTRGDMRRRFNLIHKHANPTR